MENPNLDISIENWFNDVREDVYRLLGSKNDSAYTITTIRAIWIPALLELDRMFNQAIIIHIPEAFKTLDEMIRTIKYIDWLSDKLGNDLFLSDPERADRIYKYAEDGVDGSTHYEVLEDYRDYLENIVETYDLEDGDPDNYERCNSPLIFLTTYNNILREIEKAMVYHI